MEEWKRVFIKGVESNYEISNLGRCRNITKLDWKTKGVLKPRFNNKNGYYSYNLILNGTRNYFYAHRLVAMYFLPNPENLPQVNHIDGDKSNNCVDNLEWCDQYYNMNHAFNTGLTSINKPILLYSLKGEYVGEFISITEAVKYIIGNEVRVTYGIDSRALKTDEDNIYFQQLGYQWRLKDGDNRKVIDISKTCQRQNISVVQVDLEGNVVNIFKKVHDAYEYLGIRDNGSISQACKGKYKTYHGFKWYYLSDWNEMKNK